MRKTTPQRVLILGLASSVIAATAACSASTDTSSKGGVTTITVATASVPQFDDLRQLTTEFEKDHPDIKVKYVNLPEDQLRDQLTQGVATDSSPFDVVSIGPYEVPIWAKNGWLENINKRVDSDPAFDAADIIPAVKAGLEYNDNLYAVPISGESSMLMYRKDIFAKSGITMPDQPSWDDINQVAAQVQAKNKGMAGICLRGDSSWGAAMAVLNPILNTYGATWYNDDWKPQFSSPKAKAGMTEYLTLQRKYGIPGAASAGFPECLTAFTQGKAAMWFDATSAGSSVEDPKTSKVVGKIGYAPAPIEDFDSNGWLWSWNLAMTSTTKHDDAAWEYMKWAGSKEYVQLAGKKLGWNRAPAATRESTYQIPKYVNSAPYAQLSLDMIKNADPTNHPSPTPYSGTLFLLLPSYQDFGTSVSQLVSAAVAGSKSVDDVASGADKILAKFSAENKKWTDSDK